MNKSGNFYKDIIVGAFFIFGIFGFMSGEFVVSTGFFGAASILSNINIKESAKGQGWMERNRVWKATCFPNRQAKPNAVKTRRNYGFSGKFRA